MQSTFGCRSLKQGRDWSGRDARRSRLQAPGRSHAPGQSAGERAPPRNRGHSESTIWSLSACR